MLLFQTENGIPGKFLLNPFTVYSLCKRKFVVCPFVDEDTNGLNRLAHLWYYSAMYKTHVMKGANILLDYLSLTNLA